MRGKTDATLYDNRLATTEKMILMSGIGLGLYGGAAYVRKEQQKYPRSKSKVNTPPKRNSRPLPTSHTRQIPNAAD